MITLKNLGSWLKLHFDFALILAAAVEIPRWTVTFLAIHEPLWVGIPLGALLAYATSEGWKAYFLDTHRYKLLAFNVASLAAATFVITPVLFSMASAPIDEIDLAALLPSAWLLAWAGVLAVTTFAPLIQLAAVKSTPSVETPKIAQERPQTPRSNDKGKNAPAPVAIPAVTLGHQDTSEPIPSAAAESPKQSDPPQDAKLTKEQRRALIAEWQLQSARQVMDSFGVGKRTADGDLAWVRSNTMQTNDIARDLPQLAAPHTNGFNHD